MSRTLGALLIVASLAGFSSARAAGTNVKCAMNEDRVWVYESVVDFNLAAKLKCGEPVQIIGRIKGYVKVQTQSGVEGYVADTAFPKSALPPEPEEKPNDVGSASVAALAHHTVVPNVDSKHAPASPAAPAAAPPTVASAPPAPAKTTPAPAPQPVVAKSAPPTAIPTPAPAPASQPAPIEITLSTASTPEAAPAPADSVSEPVSAPAAPAPPVAATTAPPPPAATAAPRVVNAPSSAPETRASAAPAIQPVSDSVARPAVSASVARPAPVVANPDEEEDTAVSALDKENAQCTHFFSAYGLSPNQYKWLAQNRKKAFPSVCPAPTPSLVDFVVIFTHDVDFYNVTMPSLVHVDHNGFSDWTPVSTVDNSLMTQSEADSSHHEYVWVFHTTRGAFDPAKFSSRRKPLFSKGETNLLGSRGGYRTVMDALTFIETAQTAR